MKPFEVSAEDWQDYLADEADHEIKRAKEMGEYESFCAEMSALRRRVWGCGMRGVT